MPFSITFASQSFYLMASVQLQNSSVGKRCILLTSQLDEFDKMKIKRDICFLCSSRQPSSKCHMCLFFTSPLVSGFGSARTEKCARRAHSVSTSVINLRWPTLFVSVAFAAVGGS